MLVNEVVLVFSENGSNQDLELIYENLNTLKFDRYEFTDLFYMTNKEYLEVKYLTNFVDFHKNQDYYIRTYKEITFIYFYDYLNDEKSRTVVSDIASLFIYKNELLDLTRDELIELTGIYQYDSFVDSFNDPEYLDICKRENNYTNLEGNDHLIDLTDKYLSINFEGEDIFFSESIERKYVKFNQDLEFIKIKRKSNDPNLITSEKSFYNYGQNYMSRFRSTKDGFLDDDDKKYVCVAGGFANILYREKNFLGNNEHNSDIDFFIHSCSVDKAQTIIRDFIRNDNIRHETVSINKGCVTMKDIYNTKIQFILRLYSSPSEIIHGFDIDCSCILLNLENMRFYGTERYLYSLTNQKNTVNFNRLSPSYSYRLLKYFDRGFDIYIPCLKLLKNGINFDLTSDFYEKENKGGNIILKGLVMDLFFGKTIYSVSDYGDFLFDTDYRTYKYGDIDKFFTDEYRNLKFKTQNPNEQISSTFNKTVVENNLEWFPKTLEQFNFTPPLLEDKLFCFSKEEFNEKTSKYEKENYSNLLKPSMKKKFKPYKNNYLDKMIDFFGKKYIFSGSVVTGLLKDRKFSPLKTNECGFYINCIDLKESDFHFFVESFFVLFMIKCIDDNNISRQRHSPQYSIKQVNDFFRLGKESILYIDWQNDYDYDRDYINIPKIAFVLKKYTSVKEIINDAKYDFERVLLVEKNKYVTDSLGFYSITNDIHYSKPIDFDKFTINVFSFFGMRFVINYDSYKEIFFKYLQTFEKNYLTIHECFYGEKNVLNKDKNGVPTLTRINNGRQNLTMMSQQDALQIPNINVINLNQIFNEMDEQGNNQLPGFHQPAPLMPGFPQPQQPAPLFPGFPLPAPLLPGFPQPQQNQFEMMIGFPNQFNGQMIYQPPFPSSPIMNMNQRREEVVNKQDLIEIYEKIIGYYNYINFVSHYSSEYNPIRFIDDIFLLNEK